MKSLLDNESDHLYRDSEGTSLFLYYRNVKCLSENDRVFFYLFVFVLFGCTNDGMELDSAPASSKPAGRRMGSLESLHRDSNIWGRGQAV